MPARRSSPSRPTRPGRPRWSANTSQSAAAARAAAERSLGEAGISCAGLDVTVDISAYQPGGQVQVTVSCTAQLDDVALSGLPGSEEFTASSTVPIETFRAG